MDDLIYMEPIYKDYIWGGEKISKVLNKKSPYKKTAESWEISANRNGNCRIISNNYKGITLEELFNNKKIRKVIFGTNCENMEVFPLLIKFIDANDNLSIQVHPNDDYAKKIGQPNGKTEMWYIMDCEKNSQIIGGLKNNFTKKELETIIEKDELKKYLNYINIKPGDSVFIEAGTVHAILKNSLICEIQQNNDITYRIYDWDRKDENGKARQLHKKEAVETIISNNIPIIKHTTNKATQNLINSKYFTVDKIICKKEFNDNSDKKTFYAINVVKGNGLIEFNNKKRDITQGDSFIIPATLGKFSIKGQVELLKSYIC